MIQCLFFLLSRRNHYKCGTIPELFDPNSWRMKFLCRQHVKCAGEQFLGWKLLYSITWFSIYWQAGTGKLLHYRDCMLVCRGAWTPHLGNSFIVTDLYITVTTLFSFENVCVHSLLNRVIGLMNRVFANGPGDQSSIPRRVIPKTQKMVLDVALLNTQHYKVRIKGKAEQSKEWSSTFPFT